PRRWPPFWSAFAHVVRNAVDHGVETTEQRIAAGKAERAAVALGIAREESQVVVTISDDGRGIDWERIAAQAKDRGLPNRTPHDLEEALFSDGLSSRGEATATS